MFAQWDDHEVTNNWWPGEPLTRAEHRARDTSRQNALVLAARASRAFHEYMPMRADAGRAGPRLSQDLLRSAARRVHARHAQLSRPERRGHAKTATARPPISSGRTQIAWLKRELMSSRATWKVIAADMPIGLSSSTTSTANGASRRSRRATTARRAAASSRSPTCSSFIKHAGVRNTVWLTADVHYTAAHYYDPEQGGVPGFRAVLGVRLRPDPCRHLRARTSSTSTFGPQLVYVKGAEQGAGREPAALRRLQFFGHVAIDGATERDDGDAQGRRRPRAVGENAGAETRLARRRNARLNAGIRHR